MKPDFRVGMGYDLHRTRLDRPLVLGGVPIPSPVGLAGHSDADIVLHALCDALLGGLALGDIGELFPDTDPRYKDADSREFVREARTRVEQAGYRVHNVDVVVHAERPRLSTHKASIQASLAELLDLPENAIGIKATTNEGLGPVGRGEAMACWVIALMTRA